MEKSDPITVPSKLCSETTHTMEKVVSQMKYDI